MFFMVHLRFILIDCINQFYFHWQKPRLLCVATKSPEIFCASANQFKQLSYQEYEESGGSATGSFNLLIREERE